MHANHTAELVLERLPNGEHALLRPEPEDVRYTITDLGRRALAENALFGPWPTVAEACAA